MIIIPPEFEDLNLEGKVVGLTSGCYDLIHFWHLHYLERCRAQCDFLIVGVDSDALVQHFKQKTPIIPEYNRVALVAALRCVKAAFIMRDLSQFQTAARFATKIFKNTTELYGQKIIGEEKLVVIPDVIDVQSTSALVEKIRYSDVGCPSEPRARL